MVGQDTEAPTLFGTFIAVAFKNNCFGHILIACYYFVKHPWIMKYCMVQYASI